MTNEENNEDVQKIAGEFTAMITKQFSEAKQNDIINAVVSNLSAIRNAGIKKLECELEALKQTMPFLQKAITKD